MKFSPLKSTQNLVQIEHLEVLVQFVLLWWSQLDFREKIQFFSLFLVKSESFFLSHAKSGVKAKKNNNSGKLFCLLVKKAWGRVWFYREFGSKILKVLKRGVKQGWFNRSAGFNWSARLLRISETLIKFPIFMFLKRYLG